MNADVQKIMSERIVKLHYVMESWQTKVMCALEMENASVRTTVPVNLDSSPISATLHALVVNTTLKIQEFALPMEIVQTKIFALA